MAKYRSSNSETRVYPTLGITVAPDEVIELPDIVKAVGLELDNAKTKAAVAEVITSEESN
jgi:hypothetical protein